jgi:hypothetical protein
VAGGIVEVDPASVLRAAGELRQASRLYSAVGWRIRTSLPFMPPVFAARAEVTVDVAAARLQALATRLDLDAAVEGWRMSRLGGADAGDVGGAVRQFAADLSTQGRLAWDDLSAENGLQATADPLGRSVHLLLGAADDLSQLFRTAMTFGQATPMYAIGDPAGAGRARQEIVAMAINLLMLFPESAVLDPEAHRRALSGTAASLLDWNDLKQGDVPRWTGHVGTGLLLGWLTKGLAPADSAGAADPALEGAGGDLGPAVRNGYQALSDANRLPTGLGGRDNSQPPSPLPQAVGCAESDLEGRKGR